MTAARATANRQNAGASTGPRTKVGKARAARNALRHGLAVPVNALPEFNPLISRLAKVLAGDDASPPRLELARRVAEAEVDIRRVASMRLRILDGFTAPPRQLQEKIAGPLDTSDEPEPVIARMIDAARKLARLDRYERRARSRRKFAIREMDAFAGS